MKKWTRIHYMPHTPLHEGHPRVTGSKEHIQLARQVAADGTVLLKNECKLLPLSPGAKVAVFGKGQADYVKGCLGVTTAYSRSLIQGLRIKQKEGKVKLFDDLSKYYEEYVNAAYNNGIKAGNVEEPVISDELVQKARAYTDIAIISICRHSAEGADRKGIPGDGDFYLNSAEAKMVDIVLNNFEKVIVVLNVGGIVDTTWIKEDPRVSAALLPWQGGIEGGLATADILCGDATPNGRLTDTFAENFQAYPSANSFHESDQYVEYKEDIYVGYRYFETIPGAMEKVCYPFGYGLSYTQFSTNLVSWELKGREYSLEAEVKNTGDFRGREVLQLYVQPPQGILGKPERCLIGFAKTAPLMPGNVERIVIKGNISAFASYDDAGKVCKSAYLLEAGDYRFYLGKDVRSAKEIDYVYHLPETLILEKLSQRCKTTQLPERMKSDGSYEALPTQVVVNNIEPRPNLYYPSDNSWYVPGDLWDPHISYGGEKISPQLIDVYEGKITLDEFVNVLTLEQKIHLLGGQPNRGTANTFGCGNLLLYGIPNVMTADGPEGLWIRPMCRVFTTSFPCATLLACTWDTDLVRQVGIAAAEEVKENGVGIWLAPALNIHRNPLCGRNFEYYSEDPLISGMIAAAMVTGIQSTGVAATIKHLACNNKETNRAESDSRISERALREIYLKGFEICVKQASPWMVMSSYNLINGTHTSASKDLLTGILREEWGFDGVVCTDWDNKEIQYREIQAGNDLKMASGMPEHTLQMVREGKLPEENVTESAKRVLQLILRLA